MDPATVAVVLAGGTGTRLYPASRADRPKQFRSLGGDRSLLVRAVERAAFADRRVVLTAPRHAERVREHLAAAGFAVADPGFDDGSDAGEGAADRDREGETTASGAVEVLVEPEPKDTGPALVYAAARIRAEHRTRAGDSTGDPGERRAGDPESVLVCLPSDHHVEGPFGALARHAARVATETRGLVTVGIDPDRPATGYGYVEPGREEDGYAPVRAFHEKPDRGRARRFVDEGCLWNAGVFAWHPSALLSAARGTPLAPLVTAAGDGGPSPDSDGGSPRDPDAGGALAALDRRLRAAYAEVEAVSVDHAVLERADDVFVVFPPADLAWDDLGTWDALARVLDADGAGNAVLGDALTVDAHENVVASDDGHVTIVGVDGLVVAAYDDRVLVVPTAETDRVREAVERLRERDLF